MNKPSNKAICSEGGPEPFFWESELYSKSHFRNIKKKRFRYYDNFSIFNYLFFSWVNKWVYGLSKQYIEPYKLHPLPVSDQILRWQPIFSKHVSDGIARLESYETAKSQSRDNKAKKPYKSILLRALFLTLWKRALFLIIGLIVVNVLSMSISIMVKKLLEILNDKSFSITKIFFLLLVIIICQILDGLFIENINFYVFRLICIVQYLSIIGVFQHGMCHRRKFSNDINGYNVLNVCNQVLHSCSPHSDCSKNPLYCPARRHQNKDLNPQIFNFEFNDSFYISQSFEAFKFIVEFLTNFIYGVYLLSLQVKVNIWVLYLIGSLFLFLMIFIELLSAITIKFLQYLRDYRLTKSNYIFPYLTLIRKMFYDDIAINVITKSRNNELSILFIHMFLTYFNMTLYNICINITFYMIQRYFVKSVVEVSIITDIDITGFMTSFYIFLLIINSMFLIPKSIRSIAKSYVSFKRFEEYVIECSPNFYISDNMCTGITHMHSIINQFTYEIPNNVVIYYRDATFTWVNTRSDLLNKKYEPCLKNINFELKRSEMVIITGTKGSGKSNFIKSILGEMTLVEGSMAVVPLHTSMPIFYASQDIWLQHGTIRSNITFGYKFDENLYNTVLKAVELEYDISTWEKGDLRIISDNAHSLSGGQRVRMELARAVYAYLIFNKVNKEYNNSRCSFLMCLDSPFQYIDPYVSKTIFKNLFNTKTGLLIKDDLSIVICSTKRSLDTCLKLTDLSEIPNPPIYEIKNQTLLFYSKLHDFIEHNKVNNENYKYLTSSNNHPYRMNYLTNDMVRLCSSDSNSRLGRMEITKTKYSKSFKTYVKDEKTSVKFNPYLLYITPAMGLFVIYILINIVIAVMDNVKLVMSSNLSDYITKNINEYKHGKYIDLSEIKTHSNFWLKIMTFFVSVIIILTIFSTIMFSISSNISSRKIHEYCVNSIFRNSSSVIKIKKEVNQIMTYLSCDTSMIDEDVGYILLLFLTCFIQALINLIILFYLIPISIPFVIITLIVLYRFILSKLINAGKNKQMAMLESMSQVNSICENAISGSSIYRSFKTELCLVINLIENADYNIRSRFLYRLILTWCTLIFKYTFSAVTFIVLVIPILLDKYTKYKMKVGYFGLALSLCMNVNKTFTKFSITFAKIEIYMCSLRRFKYFIPPGKKLEFGKFVNAHEEYVINPANGTVREVNESQLLVRRSIEFKSEIKKYYKLRKLFYHPKIVILDVGRYLTQKHSGVELKDVCVYTTSLQNQEGKILKNITVSAHKSDIIGMIGRTGAGKTTLLTTIQNIVYHRTGQVLLDGKDLNDIPRVVLRQIIGVLPQLPFVFKGWTTRRFLDPRRLFTDDEINKALKQCGLMDFVNNLPGGKKLDTILVHENNNLTFQEYKNNTEEKKNNESFKTRFESDTLLSNSQLRTLSLAKLVLYRNFYRIIVVDEPPEEDLTEESNLKNELGVPIYELLQKFFNHCTTFVTAHDVNVLKTCTLVWIIHDGCLLRTCKTSDLPANESIAAIIEESLRCSQL